MGNVGQAYSDKADSGGNNPARVFIHLTSVTGAIIWLPVRNCLCAKGYRTGIVQLYPKFLEHMPH